MIIILSLEETSILDVELTNENMPISEMISRIIQASQQGGNSKDASTGYRRPEHSTELKELL